jgi:hypothetical protein
MYLFNVPVVLLLFHENFQQMNIKKNELWKIAKNVVGK